ncbi:MAG TPA: hypothetical protein VGC24_04290 [Burkholderiaceae bacterium]
MFCHVFNLRESGAWNSRRAIVEQMPRIGLLRFARVPKNLRERWGRNAYVASILSQKDGKSIGLDLHWAQIKIIKEGGVMIEGTEMHSRGLKSSPERVLQTWWCAVDFEDAVAAMSRIDVRSSTGFHVNDDDRDDQ